MDWPDVVPEIVPFNHLLAEVSKMCFKLVHCTDVRSCSSIPARFVDYLANGTHWTSSLPCSIPATAQITECKQCTFHTHHHYYFTFQHYYCVKRSNITSAIIMELAFIVTHYPRICTLNFR
ncbi:hypothetical protein Ddc_15918 [Ditylenchus destructor]|nr:hypothetical protein Ddc_15918 [Ditylenchus destructor]